MIHLITGLPGAGKTIYALQYVERLRAESENAVPRQVYYHGIQNLTLDWTLIDNPENWATLPVGSIVVLDECQTTFRPRAYGVNVPPHVSALEVHRHTGIDLVLITQHPMLLDTNARRLVGRHFHIVRAFGLHQAVVHEWGEAREHCDKSRTGSIKHRFTYPKGLFSSYKSAEVHTHKSRLPARVYFLLAIPLLLGGIAWLGFQMVSHGKLNFLSGGSGGQSVGGSTKGVGSLLGTSAPGVMAKGAPTSGERMRQYIVDRTPVITDIPYSAPVYAAVTVPRVAPYPAACVASASRCFCYSQQGTRLAGISEVSCRDIVLHGFFVDWIDTDRKDVGSAGAAGVQIGAGAAVPGGVSRADPVPYVGVVPPRQDADGAQAAGGKMKPFVIPPNSLPVDAGSRPTLRR